MMSLGDGTTCAVVDSGDVKCWGRNDAGQLARGDSVYVGDDETLDTAELIELGGQALEVHTNGEQTYALLDDGTVRAWGSNDDYTLGLRHDETIGDDETPAAASVAVDVNVGGFVEQIAVGADFACARLQSGAVRCWGSNDFGQLGYGHTDPIGDDEDPADAGDLDLGGSAVSITAGAHHACALLEDGSSRCWGLGADGQLGRGTTDSVGDDETPASVGPVDLGGPIAEVVAGGYHTCARLESGAAYCWGDGQAGQLGYGSSASVGDDESPLSVGPVDVGAEVVKLAAGEEHTCAVLSTGTLRCWGDGQYGQLGYGSYESIGREVTPGAAGDVDLGGAEVLDVYIGSAASSTCVSVEGGSLRCWGRNDEGQLGYGDTSDRGGTSDTEPPYLPDLPPIKDRTDD